MDLLIRFDLKLIKIVNKNKIVKISHNQWITRVALFLLGLSTPGTISFIKDFNLIKKETINVSGNLNFYESSQRFDIFYFIFFLTIIALLIILSLILNFVDED